jgi:hypothetical protein
MYTNEQDGGWKKPADNEEEEDIKGMSRDAALNDDQRVER